MRGRISNSKALVATLVALFGVIVSCGPAGAVTQYAVTDLGTLGGSRSTARAINELGQVVGSSQMTTAWDDCAFLWLPTPAYGMSAGMHSLGKLGGGQSNAEDINDLGQIVGSSKTGTSYYQHALLWLPEPAYTLPAGLNDLGTLGGPSSWGLGINESGQVAGGANTAVYENEDWETQAFLWQNGAMSQVNIPDSLRAGARAINDAGQVVGHVSYEWGPFDEGIRGFFLDGGAVQDIGCLGGSYTYPEDINASCQVVGFSQTAGLSTHAFLWEGGVTYDLGTLGGDYATADAINIHGQIVGESHLAGSSDDRACLWEDGVIYDLNDLIPDGSGWFLRSAADINDRGYIVGQGVINGEKHACLLTPIPEPSVLGLLGLAFLVVMRRLRRGSGGGSRG